ncbi:hypothetical protein [Stutzerimonas nitrititolerans]|uniref:hypothetical protein n=1 Tax=Stutzerimonas nitrititolerans TaxID=2482751 RepID=UPI0028976265|nr:hypothetical protein [Stutzerimonas nitrititolerans]
MTLFTDGLIVRKDRNILDDVVTGQLDAAEAAFDQAMFDNPTNAVRRIGELTRAEQGRVVQQAYPAYGIPERRAEPETPLLTAEQARARIKEEGLDLTVDDTGIRAGALDILIERKRAEVQRKLILDNAPASTVPVQLLAGFGASVLDPINIASAFVPVVGEARYASMLASATSRAARLGVRARVGALEGAVGAAMVEPLVLFASAQDQSDYGAVDSLLNIAFGSAMGGGLHSVGGYISDVRRGALLEGVKAEAPVAQTSVGESPRVSAQQFALRVDEDPMFALRDSLERGIQGDRARMTEDAGRQARETLMPEIRAELSEVAAGRMPNAQAMQAERAAVQERLESLDATLGQRIEELRSRGENPVQAVNKARQSINEERKRLTARAAELADATDTERQAEIARRDLEGLQRGEIPQRYQSRIDAETGRITSGFDLRQTARARAEAAPWQVRESALRAAIAQSVTGRPVNVEAIFDLADPVKRTAALQRLKEPVETVADPEGEVASYAAGETADALDGTDLAGAERMLADEQALTGEMAAQAGIDLKPFMREADELAADAETYAAAYRAAALCQLRN